MLATLNGEPDDSHRQREVDGGIAEFEFYLALQDDKAIWSEIEATEKLLNDGWTARRIGEIVTIEGPFTDIITINEEILPKIHFPPRAN